MPAKQITAAPEAQQADSLSQQFFGQIGLPAFIITTFFPHLIPKLAKHPKLIKLLSLPLALWIGSEFLSAKLWSLWSKIMSTAMTCVTIDSEDGSLHSSMRRFLMSKKVVESHREMSAASISYLRYGVRNGGFHAQHVASGTSVVFDATNKFQFFWHNGRPFVLTVDHNGKRVQSSDITIWTPGWSPQPIRKMIVDAYADSVKQDGCVMTQVFVPCSEGNYWIQRSSRPRRPLQSVYLAEGKKEDLLKDMGEYLDPETERWYNDRGIPLRRGYLFHGKPGTGKTTLAQALAGHFGLNVYILSLLDKSIDDNTLLELFQSVGRGTLVLLEDVDCAGLEKRPEKDDKTKKRKKKSKNKQGSSVTLSGLLNAIDGVGAPESHVLIMTTNKPDTLDEALVRAGRADIWIEFVNATRSQIRDIFINMYNPSSSDPETSLYTGDDDADEDPPSNALIASPEDPEAEAAKQELLAAQEQIKAYRAEVRSMAEKFADRVPESQFSPAQLQDFLILHKNKPEAALESVAAWVVGKQSEAKKAPEKDDASEDEDSDSEDDKVFTEEQSGDSTPASSTGDADEDGEEKKPSKKAKAAKSGEGKGKADKETPEPDEGVFKDQLSGLESRLKELEAQVKSSASKESSAAVPAGEDGDKEG